MRRFVFVLVCFVAMLVPVAVLASRGEGGAQVGADEVAFMILAQIHEPPAHRKRADSLAGDPVEQGQGDTEPDVELRSF